MTDLNKLRIANIKATIQAVKDSVHPDDLIMQTIRSIDETSTVINMLAKRLRDWYALYNPETEHNNPDHEKFVNLILSKSKSQLLKAMKVSETMGADLSKKDIVAIKALAQEVQSLFNYQSQQESYLETMMETHCPNIQAVAGTTIGARLIDLAGGLKRMAIFPASTIQLLGAEKALFRHITTGAKSPKHGILIMHPLVAKAKQKGRAARLVADKISMAARIDYFKGDFAGDRLRSELEAKL